MSRHPVMIRLMRIMMYNDTRFYEFIVGLTAIVFGITLSTSYLTDLSYSQTISQIVTVVPRIIWSFLFVLSGILSLYGSFSRKDIVRYIGSISGIILWLFWGLSSFYDRGIAYPVFIFIGIKLFWVFFRISIDKYRPMKGDII